MIVVEYSKFGSEPENMKYSRQHKVLARRNIKASKGL